MSRPSQSRPSHAELVGTIGFAISRWQDAVEDFDNAVGALYALSAAERRCLNSIAHGPRPANAIARDTNLTPAAVTALLDRLETRGYVRRHPDPQDRRRILVAAGKNTEKLTRQAYLPIVEAGAEILQRYSVDEMRLLLKFIEEVETMQRQQADALRSQAAKASAAAGKASKRRGSKP